MKLVVTGQAQHGKDTVCEILKFLGFRFASSSEFAGNKAVYPFLREKYGYSSFEECFVDRHNHRQEWFELIIAYNTPDLAKLGKELFEQHDIYCGLRNANEFFALKKQNAFDFSIWVDATRRKGNTETSSSLTITREMCDVTILNNSTKENLILNTLGVLEDLKERKFLNEMRVISDRQIKI